MNPAEERTSERFRRFWLCVSIARRVCGCSRPAAAAERRPSSAREYQLVRWCACEEGGRRRISATSERLRARRWAAGGGLRAQCDSGCEHVGCNSVSVQPAQCREDVHGDSGGGNNVLRIVRVNH